jgi:hypothetical protein
MILDLWPNIDQNAKITASWWPPETPASLGRSGSENP